MTVKRAAPRDQPLVSQQRQQQQQPEKVKVIDEKNMQIERLYRTF
jgi:hypothetical protein